MLDPAVNMMFFLLLAVFIVVFAFMGIMLLVRVIKIVLAWNYGKRKL